MLDVRALARDVIDDFGNLFRIPSVRLFLGKPSRLVIQLLFQLFIPFVQVFSFGILVILQLILKPFDILLLICLHLF